MNRKKLLALLLCLAMCLALIPTGFAEDIEIIDTEDEIALVAEPEPDEPDKTAPGPDAEIQASPVASGSCGGSLTWKLYDNGRLTIYGSGDMTDYERKGAPWYAYRDQITKLSFSSDCRITRIGNYAFADCQKMELTGDDWIRLPWDLKSIGQSAFLSCQALSYVCIPENVTSIETQAFGYCYGLKHASFRGAPTIGYIAFGDCKNLEEISFLGDVPSFHSGTFDSVNSANAINATTWYPPDNGSWTASVRQNYGGTLTWMAGYHGWAGDDISWHLNLSTGTLALSGTGSIKPHSTSRHSYTSLQNKILSISIGEGITAVGAASFYGMDQVESVSLPSTLTYIGDSAFRDCTSLSTATIPAAVTEISTNAFDRCTALKEIRFLGHAPVIGSGAFFNVTATVYYYPTYTWTSDKRTSYGGTLTWVKDDKVGDNVTWYLYDSDVLALYGSGATWEYNSGVPGFYGFRGEVTGIQVNANVSAVGEYLFWRMDKVKRATMPSGLESIGSGAFSGCTALEEIVFNGNAPSFASNCFYKVTATACYHGKKIGWTSSVMQNYGGSITWRDLDAGFVVTIDDKTKGAATCSLTSGGTYSGSQTFTVSADRAVLVAVKNADGSYTRLNCTVTGTQHSFTFTPTSNTNIALVYMGDVNLDGQVQSLDGTMIKRASLGTYELDALKTLVCDINGDGVIKSLEGTMVIRASLGTYTIPW